MDDQDNRATLEQHWAASQAGDQDTEHAMYHEKAVLEYPQSGERFHGRRTIQASCTLHPAQRTFTIRRIVGGGDLWITEYLITYDGRPVYTVSIMEFRQGRVVRETQYFADPFEAPAWRRQWTEQTG
jgi:ketosteroid isomerase-like protein